MVPQQIDIACGEPGGPRRAMLGIGSWNDLRDPDFIMRVIAATFTDLDTARDSLRRLTAEVPIRAEDAQIAPHADGFVLGLRLPKELHATVGRIIHETGGRVLVDVPEAWTRGTGYVPATPDQDPAPTTDPVPPAVPAHGATA